TAVVCAVQRSMTQIRDFPAAMLSSVDDREQGRITCVDGLERAFYTCYEQMDLPSELKFSWAAPGRLVNVEPLTVCVSPVSVSVSPSAGSSRHSPRSIQNTR